MVTFGEGGGSAAVVTPPSGFFKVHLRYIFSISSAIKAKLSTQKCKSFFFLQNFRSSATAKCRFLGMSFFLIILLFHFQTNGVCVCSFFSDDKAMGTHHFELTGCSCPESSYSLGHKPISQPALSQTLVRHSVIVIRHVCSVVSNLISRHLRGLPPRRCR